MDPQNTIENVINRYAWAYDMNLLDELAECYAVDAVVTFDGDDEPVVGRDAIVAEMRRRRAKVATTDLPWHLISNVYISSATPETISAVSRYTVFVLRPKTAITISSVGYYDDVFVSDAGIWRLSRRKSVRVAKSEAT